MRRRAAMLALAAAAAVPRAAAQPRVRTVGFVSDGGGSRWLAKLLAENGWVEGHNLRLEHRLAGPGKDGSEQAARELVGLRPEVLVAFGALHVSVLSGLTRTIPIVCGGTADPVGSGFAKTLHRPGANVTGLSLGVPEMAEMHVGLLRLVRPRARRMLGFVGHSPRPGFIEGWTRVLRSLIDVARDAGIAWELKPLSDAASLDGALAATDPALDLAYVVNLSGSIPESDAAAAMNARRLASFGATASFVRAGGLMHYVLDHADRQRRVASMVDRILRGGHPAEMPFELPDRTTFIVNRATARTIGLTLPAEILARATEIIG